MQETHAATDEAVPSSPPPSRTLLDLPTELLQEIAFFSFNPNLYRVSHQLRARLCSQRDFVRDLTLALLCNRHDSKSTWFTTKLPWRTGAARRWDLAPSQTEREMLQRQVFDLEYITASCVSMMIKFVHQTRREINRVPIVTQHSLNFDRPSTYSITVNPAMDLSAFLAQQQQGASHNRTFDISSFQTQHQPGLFESPFVRDPFSVGQQGVFTTNVLDRLGMPNLFTVHFLYVPSRLLGVGKGADSDELGQLLLSKASLDSLNHSIVKRHVATAKPLWMYS